MTDQAPATPGTASKPEYKVSIFDREAYPNAELPVAGIWKLWVDEQGRRCSLAAGEIYNLADANALASILGFRADSEWMKYGDSLGEVSAANAPTAPSEAFPEIERLKAENASILESLREADGIAETARQAMMARSAAEQRAEAAEKELGGLRIALDDAEHDAQLAEAQAAAAEQRNTELEGALRDVRGWLIERYPASLDVRAFIDAALHDEERSAPPQEEK